MTSENQMQSPLIPEDFVDPNSIQARYYEYQGKQAAVQSSQPWYLNVNYSTPSAGDAVSFGSSSDPFIIDSDPTGEKTVRYGRENGLPYTTDTILSLNLLGGRTVSHEWLSARPEGRELLSIALNNRKGRKRDFIEAVTDVSPSDLPYMSLVGTSEGSVRRAVQLSNVYRKLQNKEAISEDESLLATLAFAKSQRAENGTWGAMVGDIIRAAPGFMTEFALSGQIGAAARTAAAKSAKTGIHLSMTRASKVLTDELIEVEAKRLAGKAAAKATRNSIVDSVAKSVWANTMLTDSLYKGLSPDVMLDMATRRASYAYGKYLSRTQGGAVANGFNKFTQYWGRHVSRGVMDFGTWGTEASTVAFSSHTTAGRALSDAMGAFLIEAPLQGGLLLAPNQFIAKPLIGHAFGDDGKTVSPAQLGLQQAALFTDNKALMDNAESIALAQNILEYVSESAGRGFSPLLRSAGLTIDKLVAATKINAPRLVAPASRVVHSGANGRLISEDTGVTVGGILRKWVDDVLGTAQDYKGRMMDRKADVVAKVLGATEPADKRAVAAMVMSGSKASLRPELARQVGEDVSKFIDDAMSAAYEAEKKNGRIKAYARYAMAEWMNKYNISPQSVMNLYKKMGYDGVLGEIFEERYSDVAKGLFGWDERSEDEKGFFENIAQAVKNIWPEGGFAQLTAEATAFTVPLLTRAFTMRAIAAVGGGGVVEDTKRQLAVMRDVFCTSETGQMKYGTFLALRDYRYKADEADVEEAQKKLDAAKNLDVTDEVEIAGLEENLKNLKLIRDRRKERYDEASKSIEAIAGDNMDAMVNVQLWSDQALLSDTYHLHKSYTEDQMSRSTAGHVAMIDFAPELAKRLHAFESAFEGEDMPWYRTIASKLIGFTGGLLTGDFSGMTHNPIQWHAQDYRLSRDVCLALKKAYGEEWEHQKELLITQRKDAVKNRHANRVALENRIKELEDLLSVDARPDQEFFISATEREKLTDEYNSLSKQLDSEREAEGPLESTFAIPKEEITAATDKAIAARARRIMAAHLQTQQLRSFTQSRVKDQAIEHLATSKEYGYTFTLETDEAGNSTPMFVKTNADGEFTDEKITPQEFYEAHSEDIDKIADDITFATVDLMTSHLTHPETSRSKLLALVRMPHDYPGLTQAIYDSALSLISEENLGYVYKVSRGGMPLRAQLEGAASKINMDVVSYIARFNRYDDKNLDTRAYESIAHAIGETFDGTEEDLKARNERIFRLARLANAVKNKNVLYFTGSTAKVQDHDSRINSGNAFFLKAVIQDDGTYSVTTGINPETGEPIKLERKTYDELVSTLADMNYTQADSRIAFTTAKIFEFDDMFTALREFNLIPEYLRLCRGNQHPMLEKNSDGVSYKYETEEAAFEEFERLRALASRWNEKLQETTTDVTDEDAEKIKEAWEKLYDPKNGFVTIGEKLLRGAGFGVDSLDKYAGKFVPYKRARYTVSIDLIRGAAEAPVTYVPVDFSSGVSPVSSILNAHVMDAYAKHPTLLRSVLNGPLSTFVRDVSSLVDIMLEEEDIKADPQLSSQLKEIQSLYCTGIDRYDKASKKLHRGAGLTPRAFTMFATQFALRRAGKTVDAIHSRAWATLAPAVYRLSSYSQFMNVVDLALGGNGFLNEIIARGAKKEEVFGAQKGIRALLAEIEGDPNAFRNAFMKSLPLGMTYDRFVSTAQEQYKDLVRSGVPTAHSTISEETLAVSKAASVATPVETETETETETENSEYDQEAKHMQMIAKKAEARSQDLAKKTDEFLEDHSEDLEKAAEALELKKNLQRLETTRKNLADKNLPVPTELNEQIAEIKDRLTGSESAIKKIEVQASELGGTTVVNLGAEIKGTPAGRSQYDEVEIEDQSPTPDDSDDSLFAVVSGTTEELPSIFEKITDDGELSIVFGAKQSESRELTPNQARLAVNVALRAAITFKRENGVAEQDVLDAAYRLFPGLSPADKVSIIEEYRAIQATLAKQGRSLEDFNPKTGNLWVDEEDKDDKGSSDNFNEKSVAQFESKELKDFLALAQRCSPETGRNFQAFVSNIRELNRWQKNFMNNHESDYPRPAIDAVEFLHDVLNPRGNAKGKTMTQRLALFEDMLRQFDDQPQKVRSHIKNLLSGGSQGHALSSKGAFLISYLMSLSPNARNTFAVLVSNSLVCSAVRVNKKSGVFDAYVRPSERIGEDIVVNSFAGIIGKTRGEVAEIPNSIREKIKTLQLVTPSIDKDTKKPDLRTIDPVDLIKINAGLIADLLAPVIGVESPLFSALTSDRFIRYLRLELARGGRHAETVKGLAESLLPWDYAGTAMEGRTKVEFVDVVLVTLDLLSGNIKNSGRSGKPEVALTRGEVSSFFTSAFMTGDALRNRVSNAPNTPSVTSPLMTLMALYDASLPETVVRADFDKERSKKVSSVAVASRGCIPLGNRFMDREYDRLCETYFKDVSAEERAQCKADMVWPDKFRTPVFAKSLTRHLSVSETVVACQESFNQTKKGNAWWVPVYAGDHASAVMVQLPAVAKSWEGIDATDYVKSANAVCKWFGLDLLGADAKRSAVSSLECQAASMVGVLDRGDEEKGPTFGENRLVIVETFSEGFSNEELKGMTLMSGYGARQIKSLAKDSDSSLLKVHLINPYGDRDLSFIKSLSVATNKDSGKFAQGSTLRVLSDFLDGLVKNEASTAVLTDRDSAKIGPAISPRYITAEGEDPTSVRDIIFKKLNALHSEAIKAGKTAKLDYTSEEIDALVGGLKDTVTGETVEKVSTILPGVEITEVKGLHGPSFALSYQENDMTAYPVANVSHDSVEPSEAGRTPRNHEIDAVTMAEALIRYYKDRHSEVGALSETELNKVLDLIADWGIAATATVNDPDFRRALIDTSSAIRDLLRHGENIDGQNVKEELTRMINARLRHHLNIPLNAADFALVSSGALVGRDKNGNRVIFDHTVSEMHRAMHRGSQLFSKEETKFYGVKRRVAHCNVNVRAVGFRYGWFLDESKFNESTDWAKKYFEGTGEVGERATLVALERLFTALREAERTGPTKEGNIIRSYIGGIFKNHHNVYLNDQKNLTGRTVGKDLMRQYSFEDLFRNDGVGGRVFDRSAVCIGADKVHLDADGRSHIFLGGTLFGLPRTPSYNGSMWLQVVRAGLPVTEIEREIKSEKTGTAETVYRVGYDGCVQPDPWTLEILGCDHDGDKTKLYFLHSNGKGSVDFGLPPSIDETEAGIFAADVSARGRYRDHMIRMGMMARKYVDDDGDVHELTADDEPHEREFYDISEETRKRISNTFVQSLFDMAYALPTVDPDGNERQALNSRVPFGDGAVSRPTSPLSCVGGKDGMKELKSAPNVPNGHLIDSDGNKKNIGDIRVMMKVSDGANDASSARANIVAIMKDLHLAWASGLFKDLFRNGDSAIRWFNFSYHADGISNSTFDDMKEQICSRLGWRSGMIDILLTDILRNRQENGDRGDMPTTDREFIEILKAYSSEINTDYTARWWMNRSTDATDADARATITERLGGGKLVTQGSVAAKLGLTRSKDGKKWTVDTSSNTSKVWADVGAALVDNGLEDFINDISRGRGVNYASGYVVYLAQVSKENHENLAGAVQELKNWFEVKHRLTEARDTVKSFNYLNIDVGNDVESGTRKRLSDTFLKLREAPGVPELPRYAKMHAAMMAAYDTGTGIVTTAARGMQASHEYKGLLNRLFKQSQASVPIAKSFLLDRIEAFPGNRMQLQSNVQQVPYVIAALQALPEVAGSPIVGMDSMYKALRAMAEGVLSTTDEPRLDLYGSFALRRAIEGAFDLMYRIATSSDEHRLGNGIFSYFGTTADTEYSEGYGSLASSGLVRIRTKFRANDDTSVDAIRNMAERVIQGESFVKPPKNTVGYPLKFSSFSLNADTLGELEQAFKNRNDEDSIATKRRIAEVKAAITECKKLFKDFEITPAMMFGQLLPMYSVLNSRTTGAPVPNGTSLFSQLPLRIYQAISDAQAKNDLAFRDLIDLAVTLNWAPRKISLVWGTRKTFGVKTAAPGADKLSAQIESGRAPKIKTDENAAGIYTAVRGSEGLNDIRENPDYRDMFDLFAVDGHDGGGLMQFGLVYDIAKACNAVPESQREHGTTLVSDIIKGVEAPSSSEANVEYKPAVEMFANAMGALTGSWTTVDYKGGDCFTISGALKGDLGRNRNVLIYVTLDEHGDSFADKSADIEYLAGSPSFASSFCASTNFKVKGQPLTTEKFMTLPISVRKALVQRYQVGAATSNKVAWTVNGRGVATLVGAIRLNKSSNSTKIYHEYFHQMMRMFEALGQFGEYDYDVFAKTFGAAPEGTNWRFNEEAAAEAFRGWVIRNTNPSKTAAFGTKKQMENEATEGIFRRIFNFLKGLMKVLKTFISYDTVEEDGIDGAAELLFNMMVHGIAQSSGVTRAEVDATKQMIEEKGVSADGAVPSNPEYVRVAGGIRGYSDYLINVEGDFRGRGAHSDPKDSKLPVNTYPYSKEDIIELFPEYVEDGKLNAEGEDLFKAQSIRYQEVGPTGKLKVNVKKRKIREQAITFISQRELTTLRKPVEDAIDKTLRGENSAIDYGYDGRNVTDVKLVEAAGEAERELLNDIAAGHDIAASLDKLTQLRVEMAEKGGFSFSETPAPAEEARFTVEPAIDPVKEAVNMATIMPDRVIDSSDISITSRIGSLIMTALENGLKTDGSWGASLEDAMKALGNPKVSDSMLDRDIAISTIRNVLKMTNPEALKELSNKEIQDSIVFEALLRVHQRLESSFATQDATAPGAGARRPREYSSQDLSRFNLGAWLFSSRYPTPQFIANYAFSALNDLVKEATNYNVRRQIQLLRDNIRKIKDALDDPTGLVKFSTRGLDQLIDDAIVFSTRGTEPVDGNNDARFDEQGFFKDVRVVRNPAKGLSKRRADALHLCQDSNGLLPPVLQNALRISKTAAFHLAAMVKFYRQTETTPFTAADIEYHNIKAKFNYAKAIDDQTWMATQAIGSSMLLDNRNLIDFYDQSYFIASNVDSYMSNLVRKSFGGVTIADAFEVTKEFGAIKSEILNLENFVSFLFGTDVEDGGAILEMLQQDREFTFELGEVKHTTGIGTRIKFDNYHNRRCTIRLTREDLRMIDMFLKMCSAYAGRQRGVVTGVDGITFNQSMSTDPRSYTLKRIKELYEAVDDGGRQLTSFEMSLYRMTAQIPHSILFDKGGLYDRYVNAVCEVARNFDQYKADLANEKNVITKQLDVDFNTYMLRELSRRKLLVAQELPGQRAHDGHPRLSTGVLTINCDTVDQLFRSSDAFKKLTSKERCRQLLDENGNVPSDIMKMFTRDYVRDVFMKVYHKAGLLAAKHPWITEGDGRFLNNFGTALPFFRGSGVFMYDANRVKREVKRSYTKNLSKYEEAFLQCVQSKSAGSRFVAWAGTNKGDRMLDFLADLYNLPIRGKVLLTAIDEGKYANENDYGLLLRRDCTLVDVADSIYSKLLELAEREEQGVPPSKNRKAAIPMSGEKLIEIYESHRGVGGEMFGGHTGLNDEQMFRLYGVLPANEQLGHKIHKAIDGITNAMIQRSTLVTMLMTPAGDGSPVYYANPSDYAVEMSGIPDVVWEQLARWWAQFNGFTYDEKLSGVKNAQKIYRALETYVKDNKGYNNLAGNGDHTPDKKGHRYTPLNKADSDLLSVTDWLVQDDEHLGGDSSLLNGCAGGEAMGYLKHLVQSSRVLGFGGPKVRATLHRALSWSKSMSVSFSFFFPIATKWESPVGAVGAMATLGSNIKSAGNVMRSNPELFNTIQKMFGGSGWITKDFLGFSDILEMMDSNDPFLAELISWAEALGIKISDRFVNPSEPSRGIVEHDLRYLKNLVKAFWKDDAKGSKAAARFARFTDALMTRHGEKAFSYALNATKLATVAQMYMKLKREAEAQGRAFDPIRDLRKYAGYINAEVGGIDPLKYAWTHPRGRGILNSLLFSWEWTLGAWEAGGGGALMDFILGGRSTTKEEREFLLGRWSRMFVTVMIGVPAMMQMVAWSLAHLLGGGDDDDTPFTWMNEDKTRLTAADITPLLKCIGQSNLMGVLGKKTIADIKKDHPYLLGLLPAYTGGDAVNQKTQNRRLYIHFGKQGWEFFRWFDSPWKQFIGKLAMPWQRGFESFVGYNPSYIDRALPWEDKGALERWIDPSMDGAVANLMLAFIPFATAGMSRIRDAGALSMVGPIQYGASWTNINDRMADAIEAYARNDRKFYTGGYSRKGPRKIWMRNMLTDIIRDAKLNGITQENIDKMIASAAGQVTNKLYGQLLGAMPEDPSKDFDAAEINRIGRALNRAGAKRKDILASLKNRLESQHRGWKDVLTPQQRAMYKALTRGIISDPYSSTAREAEVASALQQDY